VRDAAARAFAAARGGDGPQFIEAVTYRFSDHGRGDPVQYRPAGEMEAWKLKDPLKIARDRITAGGVPEETLAAVERGIVDELAEIRAAALAGPMPATDSSRGEFKVAGS